jgi:hypothetical protein
LNRDGKRNKIIQNLLLKIINLIYMLYFTVHSLHPARKPISRSRAAHQQRAAQQGSFSLSVAAIPR